MEGGTNPGAGSGGSISGAWVDFAAGWCSGAAAVVALQPVDTVLTRWQAGVTLVNLSGSGAGASGVARASSVAAAPLPAGSAAGGSLLALSEARALASRASLRALWSGSSPMVTAVPFQNALLMGGYGVGQKWYGDGGEGGGDQNRRDAAVFVGGCVGGIFQSFLMSPVELVKVNQQCRVAVQVKASSGGATSYAGQVLSQLIRGSPLAWRGLGATLLRDGIPHGVWFLAYEKCKRACVAQLNENQAKDGTASATSIIIYDDDDMPASVPLLSGAVAATVAWAVGYPADVVKTRLQYDAYAGIAGGSGNGKASRGIWETGRQLVSEADGSIIRGLYRGFGIKLVRAVPASMIGFGVYEFVKKHIQNL